MASRMDRYRENSNDSISRLSKNEILYKEISNNKTYTEFTDIDNDNVYEIDSLNEQINKRRSNTNRKSIFRDDEINSNTRSQNIKPITYEERNYNINDILEEAKKNRSEMDEEEKKRKIKSVEYSILSDLSQEKLKDYHEKKESGMTQAEEDNLEELIHTITSNSLRKKIDDELLNELLPDKEDETLVSNEMLEEIKRIKDEETKPLPEVESDELDDSFYTRSMDLRKEDLIAKTEAIIDEEIDESFKEGKGSIIKNIAIIMLVILVIGIIGYIIYKFI